MVSLDVGDMRFGGAALGFRRQHDRCAVRVIRTDIAAVMTAAPLESHPDIGLDLLEHMAKVQRSIGIGESGGHENLARCHWRRGP